MFSPIVAIASLDLVADRLSRPGTERRQGLDVAVDGKRRLRRAGDQRLEGVVAGDEVSFGVQLDHGGTGAVRRHADKTLSRDATGLLGGLRQAPVRSQSTAASMSPLFSARAALQSIMPTPVFSRSSFTIAAVMLIDRLVDGCLPRHF
ncbi:MAG: hypothetical protein HPM95_16670 [Alphaproteobacteria bacterium]|nr:hypothetical protein [Alphaproteobacteria bacterium]